MQATFGRRDPGKSPPSFYTPKESIQVLAKGTCLMDKVKGVGQLRHIEKKSEESLNIAYSCSNIKDKINVIWQLYPVDPHADDSSLMASLVNPDIQKRAPLRLVLVVDASCSMEEGYGTDDGVTKLDRIKLFAQLLVQSVDEDDSLGIVTFGTKSNVVLKLSPMTADEKRAAIFAIESIEAGGVTNIGAGLCTAVDQFKTIYTKSRYHNDNIILFTDGMANEGIVETDEMVRELRKRIDTAKEECHYEKDYTVKIATLGTGGFLPELIYDIGQIFSSDAYYFLDEFTNLELNLMRPVLLCDASVVTSITINITALNGVSLNLDEMPREYEIYEPKPLEDEEVAQQETTPAKPAKSTNNHSRKAKPVTSVKYYIRDIAWGMHRDLLCVLNLPKNHKKQLKNKEVLQIDVTYRDREDLMPRLVSSCVSYSDIPKKELNNLEMDLLIATEQEIRLRTQRTLNKSAEYVMKLDRAKARANIQAGCAFIRAYVEHLCSLVGEEAAERIVAKSEPLLENLQNCDAFLSDMAVRWDDAWGRMKALSSSIGRQVPTASGVYVPGHELFMPAKVDERMNDLMHRLKELYHVLGLATETIDSYKTVMRELQNKLEKMESDDNYRETRI